MVYLIILFFFIFGTVVGSFLNVVVLRYGTGKSMVAGRSRCFVCSRTLLWYELVPVLSFAFLRGRCRTCESALSMQYPLVESATGIVFALTAGHILKLSDISQIFSIPIILITGYYLIVFSLLISLSVYDIRHKIIPNTLVYSFIILALLKIFSTTSFMELLYFPGAWSILAGPMLAVPFAALWFLSRGRWMGFGDAKLALGIGWFLGLSGGLAAIVFSFWIGAILSLLLLAVRRYGLFYMRGNVTMKSEIPFGPFMTLSTFIVFLLNLGINDIILALSRLNI